MKSKPKDPIYADLWGRRIVANDSQHAKWYMSHMQAWTAAEKLARSTGVEHFPFQPPRSAHYVVARGTYAMPAESAS